MACQQSILLTVIRQKSQLLGEDTGEDSTKEKKDWDVLDRYMDDLRVYVHLGSSELSQAHPRG